MAGLLWPDRTDAEARANLRQAVHQIHQHIPRCLATTRDTLQLNPGLDVFVDALRFAEEIQMALGKPDDAEIQERLRRTISLYQGDFLSGVFVDGAEEFEDWALSKREHLHGLAFESLRRLTQAALAHERV
ncbi:MAG: hypothetical protein R2856_12560 [Caldilineaceae bacterium]